MTDIPPEERRTDMEVASWDGPIPPPATLREIDAIVPGAAKRIIDQFEAEGTHRRRLQVRAQALPFADLIFARVCGLLFAAGCLVLVGYAISHGAGWAAAVLSAALVIGGINAIMRRYRAEGHPTLSAFLALSTWPPSRCICRPVPGVIQRTHGLMRHLDEAAVKIGCDRCQRAAVLLSSFESVRKTSRVAGGHPHSVTRLE